MRRAHFLPRLMSWVKVGSTAIRVVKDPDLCLGLVTSDLGGPCGSSVHKEQWEVGEQCSNFAESVP